MYYRGYVWRDDRNSGINPVFSHGDLMLREIRFHMVVI
jgi:hypothetical protein